MMKDAVYIKIDEYQSILDVIHLTQEKIKRSRYLLNKISELKGQEDEALEKWQRELEEVEHRLHAIDQTLFKP